MEWVKWGKQTKSFFMKKFSYLVTNILILVSLTCLVPIWVISSKLKISCAADGIYIECEDGVENIFWSREALKACFEKKYKNKFVYAKALSRGEGANEEFKFIEAYEVSGFDYDAFISLLEEGKIYVDLRIGQYHHGRNKGKTHDHGTGFRIKENDQHLLFKVKNKIG